MMKKTIFALAYLFSFFSVFAQPVAFSSANFAFERGEELTFRFFYDSWLPNITAGYGTLKVTDDRVQKYGRNTYHVEAEGKSKGLFNVFMKVHDKFESFFDEEDFRPYLFVRRTREGGYRKDDDILFNHTQKEARSRTATKAIKGRTFDIISAFYYSRNMDLTGLKTGDIVEMPFFFDDSLYNSAVQYLGKQEVKTDFGRFRCLKFRPMVATGKVFKDPYPMVLYVTDDLNRIPVMAESALIVGKVKMELVGYKGLKNEVTSRISN
jgi:hypothetical protein